MTIQLTVIRIEGYGPWTITLGSDREAKLQILQAGFYRDLQKLFSDRDCLVYANRFDEYFAITNGLSVRHHVEIKSELSRIYENLTTSMAIGSGTTPYQANLEAYKNREIMKQGTHNDRIIARDGVLLTRSNLTLNIDDYIVLLHIDISNSSNMSSKMSPYEITCMVSKVYCRLAEEFLKKEALTFYLGGDNFMVVSNATTKQEIQKTIKEVSNGLNVRLNCGIGIGRTGRQAASAATKALDTIRDLRQTGKDIPVYEVSCL